MSRKAPRHPQEALQLQAGCGEALWPLVQLLLAQGRVPDACAAACAAAAAAQPRDADLTAAAALLLEADARDVDLDELVNPRFAPALPGRDPEGCRVMNMVSHHSLRPSSVVFPRLLLRPLPCTLSLCWSLSAVTLQTCL